MGENELFEQTHKIYQELTSCSNPAYLADILGFEQMRETSEKCFQSDDKIEEKRAQRINELSECEEMLLKVEKSITKQVEELQNCVAMLIAVDVADYDARSRLNENVFSIFLQQKKKPSKIKNPLEPFQKVNWEILFLLFRCLLYQKKTINFR